MIDENSKPQDAQQTIAELQKRLEQEHNLRLAQKANMEMQAAKIQKLLYENEELGADKVQACEKLQGLLAILGTDQENAEITAAELKRWKELGQTKLASTLDAAEHQADILWSYVKAMGSPGHRAMMSFGALLGKCWLGRKLKSFCAAMLALKKA